jgi:peptide/nickel transport system permease protein
VTLYKRLFHLFKARHGLLSIPASAGFIIVGGLLVIGIIGPPLMPHGPYEVSLEETFKPPFTGFAHPLGTDALGRDMLTRIVYGARVTLLVSFIAVALGGLIGASIGIISGFVGGLTDHLLMRAADANLALPMLLLALLLTVTLGPSFVNIIIVIAAVLWARYARLIRGEVLTIRELDFIAAARVSGCNSLDIMRRHVFPNIFNTLIVLLTLQVGWAILTEASLSFLGAGVPPPMPAWGSMVAEGRNHVTSAWWISTIPGMAIMITVLGFNLLGDWLRDRLDPKLRQI